VNSTNFLKVLQGDETGMKGIGSGRVIKRFVFVFFLFVCLFALSIVKFTFNKCNFALRREVIFKLTV